MEHYIYRWHSGTTLRIYKWRTTFHWLDLRKKTLYSITLLALTVLDISYAPHGHILNVTEGSMDMKFYPTYAVLVSGNYSDIKSFLYSPNHQIIVL
jgi:hypothetical protein